MNSPYLRSRNSLSSSFRVEHLYKLFSVLLHGIFISSYTLIYSIIHLYLYGLKSFWFMPINPKLFYYIVSFVFQFCPLRALLVSVLIWLSPINVFYYYFFGTSLFSNTTVSSIFILYICILILESVVCPRSSLIR